MAFSSTPPGTVAGSTKSLMYKGKRLWHSSSAGFVFSFRGVKKRAAGLHARENYSVVLITDEDLNIPPLNSVRLNH